MEGKVDTPNHYLSKGNFGLLHYSFYLDVKNSGIWSFYSWKTPPLSAFTYALTLFHVVYSPSELLLIFPLNKLDTTLGFCNCHCYCRWCTWWGFNHLEMPQLFQPQTVLGQNVLSLKPHLKCAWNYLCFQKFQTLIGWQRLEPFFCH